MEQEKERQRTAAAAIRARLGHPVIDADGHLVEFQPPMADYIRAEGGNDLEVTFWTPMQRPSPASYAARADTRTVMPPWWGVPTRNTRDRATAALPRLLYERLDELGFDYTVLFTTSTTALRIQRRGGGVPLPEAEAQRLAARAINAYRADLCREYADRMTPVAKVMMDTPEHAIADLEHAVLTLGLKVITISPVRRPVPAIHRRYPELFPAVYYLDVLALDSLYDYDPFWKRCAELRVPIMSHGSGSGFTSRNSPSNFVYNHIGHFADASEAICKAIFLGGVTYRFPTLRFAFLEGGVGWACRLYCDLIAHWEKRNREAIYQFDPRQLDRPLYQALHAQYGDATVQRYLDQVLQLGAGVVCEPLENLVGLDDFAACGIERAEDIRDRFVPHFFFGCEADDPMTAVAFDSRLWPFGVKLNAIFGSDIGHWDVPEMTNVLPEAYELVERGLMTPADLRAFTFSNAVCLFAGANPDFFRGTVLETAAAAELARLRETAPARAHTTAE